MTATLAPERTQAPLIPPSTHRYAEVIHRLEAGGSMLPDTPENLKQIIGIYKAYAVPMDFYWRDLLYIAERVFLNPLPAFKYFISQEYLDRPNSYAGEQSQLRIWRGTEQAHHEPAALDEPPVRDERTEDQCRRADPEADEHPPEDHQLPRGIHHQREPGAQRDEREGSDDDLSDTEPLHQRGRERGRHPVEHEVDRDRQRDRRA